MALALPKRGAPVTDEPERDPSWVDILAWAFLLGLIIWGAKCLQ